MMDLRAELESGRKEDIKVAAGRLNEARKLAENHLRVHATRLGIGAFPLFVWRGHVCFVNCEPAEERGFVREQHIVTGHITFRPISGAFVA